MNFNSQAYDELAALLSQNLTFNSDPQALQPQEAPASSVPAEPAATTESITYSASQHYHHSAHITNPHEEPMRPSSEPSKGQTMSMEHILRIHGIDPYTLTPSQLQLFRVADQAQRRRLLELWSICPPDNGADIPSLAWSSTSVEHEEQLARLRYERVQQTQILSLDGTPVQQSNGAWSQQQQNQPPVESEPYMLSGYEEIMRREQERQSMESQRSEAAYNHYSTAPVASNYNPATDPVYLGPDYVREQQLMGMASQYGAFQEHRGVSDTMDVM